MKTFIDSNISVIEDLSRFVAGASLIGLVLALPLAPVWLALIAVYPIVTAIIGWDPVYAVIRLLLTAYSSPQGFGGRLAVK